MLMVHARLMSGGLSLLMLRARLQLRRILGVHAMAQITCHEVTRTARAILVKEECEDLSPLTHV